ncbi:MAG: hypothetical protein NVSMB17_04830 [Candidatus Dormibacteria bacterium]
MRRAGAGLLLATLMLLLLPVAASAHPLGNFTVNRYNGLVVAGGQFRVHYVLDMAEIPAFQEKQTITDEASYATQKGNDIAHGLDVEVDGSRVQPTLGGRSLSFPPGQGGLTTLRLELVLAFPDLKPGAHQVRYTDHNFEGRLGWREMTLQTSGGASTADSSLPSKSVSNELRTYPQDRLTSPLNVSSASFGVTAGVGAGAMPDFLARAPGGLRVIQDRYAALVAVKDLTPLAIALSLLLAVVLGAAHALSPGHGKAVMAAYLVGDRKNSRHAVILGTTITVTHTIGVFALGLVTLFLSALITPDRLYPYLTLASGLLVVFLGLSLVRTRTRLALVTARGGDAGHDHDHDHAHAHDHDHEHEHEHEHEHDHEHEPPAGSAVGEAHSHGFGTHTHAVPRPATGVRGLVAMGISGGLLPCPSALIVLLSAIGLHRLAYGIVLVIAFSIGLAGVLTGIGVALARGIPLLQRLPGRSRLGSALTLTRFASAAGAVVITLAGVGLTIQAIPQLR